MLFVQGLIYLPNYITAEEELQLLQTIDQQPWLLELKRRVQHYGYKYDYKSRNIAAESYLGQLPDWLNNLAKRLLREKIFKQLPNQLIVN